MQWTRVLCHLSGEGIFVCFGCICFCLSLEMYYTAKGNALECQVDKGLSVMVSLDCQLDWIKKNLVV